MTGGWTWWFHNCACIMLETVVYWICSASRNSMQRTKIDGDCQVQREKAFLRIMQFSSTLKTKKKSQNVEKSTTSITQTYTSRTHWTQSFILPSYHEEEENESQKFLIMPKFERLRHSHCKLTSLQNGEQQTQQFAALTSLRHSRKDIPNFQQLKMRHFNLTNQRQPKSSSLNVCLMAEALLSGIQPTWRKWQLFSAGALRHFILLFIHRHEHSHERDWRRSTSNAGGPSPSSGSWFLHQSPLWPWDSRGNSRQRSGSVALPETWQCEYCVIINTRYAMHQAL